MGALGYALTPTGCAVRESGGSGFDFRADALPPGAAMTRAGVASYEAATGGIAWAGTDVARFDHLEGRARGILLEQAGTNLIAESARVDRTPWFSYGTSEVIASALPAPDGSADAVRVRLTGASAQLQVLASLSPGALLTVSLWARRAETGGAAAVQIATTDTVTWNSGQSAFHVLTGDWRRIRLSGILSPGTNCALCIGSLGVDGAPHPDCAGDVDLWGVQVETGAVATSYIATADVPAARAADLLTLNWGMHGVPDGERMVRFTFDDGSGETRVCTVSGGVAAVPGDLARRHLIVACAI